MTLRNIRHHGRHRNKTTGKCANIHSGQRQGRSERVYYYLYRQARDIVDMREWEKVEDI